MGCRPTRVSVPLLRFLGSHRIRNGGPSAWWGLSAVRSNDRR
ncbi:hypothetical protein EBESD8_60720 [Rhodococcus aetherivorans]|nr:hypothetical protein EBESD8_60720 [Rhodococcus aetherivorans]